MRCPVGRTPATKYDTKARSGVQGPSRSAEPRNPVLFVINRGGAWTGAVLWYFVLTRSHGGPDGIGASAAGFAQAGKNERSGVVKRIREKLIELDGGPVTCEPA